LTQEQRITFSSLLSDARSRLEVIVTFIALLEMFKTREIILRQAALFGEIHIEAAPASPGPSQSADAERDGK
jgi:segregation and condensation protein A